MLIRGGGTGTLEAP